MHRPPTTLRPARPTFNEGLQYARYVDQASEGFFGFLLGRHAAQILATAFAETGHELSHEHVTFAERQGEIVAMVSALPAAAHRDSSSRPLRRAAGWRAVRMIAIQTLLSPLFRPMRSVRDADFYILFIAVDPALRGEGVGSVLLRHCEERGRTAGAERITLDVSVANPACRFYERHGMTIESRQPKLLPISKLSFYRMVKTL